MGGGGSPDCCLLTQSGVNHNNLPAHLLRVTHSRRRSAASFSVVDGQQSGGVVY